MPALALARAHSITTTNYIMRENYKIQKMVEVENKKKQGKKILIFKHKCVSFITKH